MTKLMLHPNRPVGNSSLICLV